MNSGPPGGPENDSDLRRRAAWLLGMLAVVAVLFIIVMSQLVGSGGGSGTPGGPRALDSAVGARPTASSSTAPRTHATTPSRPSSRASTATPATASTTANHGLHCPTGQACVIDGDPGNGIAAINDYRTQHGQNAVIGRVSAAAQQCALNNGNGCSGGWAETELAKPDGPAAVQKILPFAHLLDPMKNFTVGWAYDPQAKLYYFAVIRNV